jgi:hypothetical protein
MRPSARGVPEKKPHQAFATPPSARKAPQRQMLTTDKTPAYIRPVALPTSSLQRPSPNYNQQIAPQGYFQAPGVIAATPTPGVQVFGKGLQPMQASINANGRLVKPQATTARGLQQGVPQYRATAPSALTPAVPWKPGGTTMHVPPQHQGGPNPTNLNPGYQTGVRGNAAQMKPLPVTPLDMSKPNDMETKFGTKNKGIFDQAAASIEEGTLDVLPEAKPFPWTWVALAAGAAVVGLAVLGGRK